MQMRKRARRALPALGICLWLLIPQPIAADASPYQLNLPADLTISVVATAGWLLPELLRPKVVTPHCPCTADNMNALDRPVAGRFDPTAIDLSNVAVVSVYALSFGLGALVVHTSGDDLRGFASDALVMFEALAVSGTLVELAKTSIVRPRPLLYGLAKDNPALRVGDNYVSFYSSHTAGSFALALAFAQTYALRHPDNPWRFAVYGAAIAAASAVGSLRVLGGKHFPTDVLTGAGVGSAVGLLVPWLHTRSAAGPVHVAVAAAPESFQLVVSVGLGSGSL
jgi:membrane-associated phospholipid phosphatase